jgi:feruloyl-CoA synthase
VFQKQIKMNLKNTPFLQIDTIPIDIQKEVHSDGVIILKSAVPLQNCPHRLTERLIYWAEKTPNTIFIAQKDEKGVWQSLTYAETLQKVGSIAQYLLQTEVSAERPLAILSENSIEHALMALAAYHIGVPHAPIAPAYSLRSTDYGKLKHTINLLTPGLIFVQNGKLYQKAIQAVAPNVAVLAVKDCQSTSFESVLNTIPTKAVDLAFEKIQPDTLAKILFTSGSTGLPKGVMNTHGNMTTNLQQVTQTFAFVANGGLRAVDWLPWNHTFGGNHNLGLTFYNGGSLYIDGGNPTPKGIETTLQNLREIAPTVYFNVPKGFEELIPRLKQDKILCKYFFSELKMFFYAGASISQHVWDGLETLAYETTGKRLMISSGLGMTETSPACTFNTAYYSRAGMIGTPVPGLEVKLVPNGGKMEARFRGNNVMKGYWRNSEATAKAFDNEGYYLTGDALKILNPDNPNEGMVFDGRIAEDFKLDTGTWVNVGVLKAKLIAAGNGLIQDAAITGHDKSFLGAIIFPDLNYCKKLAGLNEEADLKTIVNQPILLEKLQETLANLAKTSTGSSTLIKKAIFADFELSMEKGEITDKGSINQRMILSNRAAHVAQIYNT